MQSKADKMVFSTRTPESVAPGEAQLGTGALIMNADDWGRNRTTTDRILDCVEANAMSSVSAMVFMEDSERSAAIARERGIDTGLHLNFTTSFCAVVPSRLAEHQQKLTRYLGGAKLAQAVFHPGLTRSFDYVTRAQLDEYTRLYGQPPRRIDGHHHMHLCANVLFSNLIPAGTVVRRNSSFLPGEKWWVNLAYRNLVDSYLKRRYRLADYMFSLAPLEPARLRCIANLIQHAVVEVETHPVNAEEYRFLIGSEERGYLRGFKIARNYLASFGTAALSV